MGKLNINKRFIAGLLAFTLTSGFVGFKLGKTFDKNNNEEQPTITQSNNLSNDNPVDDFNLFGLTAANFDKEAINNYSEMIDGKDDFYTNLNYVASTMFIVNIDYLSEDDIKTLHSERDLNIDEDITNMKRLFSDVATNNSKGKKYVSFLQMVYNEKDQKIIGYLDSLLIELLNGNKNNALTSTRFTELKNIVYGFYANTGFLKIGEYKFTIDDLSSGARLLAEFYWPMLSGALMNSKYKTGNDIIDFKTLTEYLTEHSQNTLSPIINHDSLNCLDDDQKNLIK